MSNSTKVLKFNMSKMGVTVGSIWGVNLFLLAIMSMLLGIGAPIIALFATFYMGYAATLVGAVIGMVLGFVHGYVLGVFGNYVIKYLSK